MIYFYPPRRELNPDLSGESQLCYPIHYQDLIKSWRSHVLLYKIDALYLPNLLDWAQAETCLPNMLDWAPGETLLAKLLDWAPAETIQFELLENSRPTRLRSILATVLSRKRTV